MKVALVSLDQVWENKNANMIQCVGYIEKAAELGADMVAFPEMTLTGFSMNAGVIAEMPDRSTTIDFYICQAKDNNIAIAFGVVLFNGDKATNNLIIVDNNGTLLTSYSKIHPFSFSGENNYYLAGDQICSCEVANVGIGLAICYDLRFPEIFQVISKKSDIILLIANWPEKRISHWKILLQARAIENQCFIIGVNRIGIDGNNQSYVKSTVVFDPIGNELKPIESYLTLDLFDISQGQVAIVRKSFPVKQDRRNLFYKSLL
ncbi:MAG: carbon-nitrogen family hydrolase [Bacteroidales bacterium]|nr:carbon-nitrogen family hydrolase [Bacteroidales bacterium]